MELYTSRLDSLSLANSSHFQCIKSRTICLRVKRRTGNKLGINNILEIFFCKKYFHSGRVGREQQRPGRLRDRRGAAGQGATGEALRPEEDQAGGHDGPLTAGREQDQQSSIFKYKSNQLELTQWQARPYMLRSA